MNTVLLQQLKQLPLTYLQRSLEDVIAIKAPQAPKALVQAMAAHILSNSSTPFEWVEGNEPEDFYNIDLNIRDVQPAFDKTRIFIEQELPRLTSEIIQRGSVSILKSLLEDWPAQKAHDKARTAQFDTNLEALWGPAFDTLRIIYKIAVELGQDFASSVRRSRSRKKAVLNNTIMRLYARACQVTLEVITLIESGLADGAMARWRTLHEIAVVTAVLVQHGEELAIRYRAHEAVEAKRALDRYEANYEVLGLAPLTAAETLRVQEAYDHCLQHYGNAFGSEYGWAAHHLGVKKPRLPDLEAAAGKSAMHSYYRMASYNVHAGSKGIAHRLGIIPGAGSPAALAGASNAGLVDPAQSTASDLVLMTKLLFDGTTRFDRMIGHKILTLLRDELIDQLQNSHQRLEDMHQLQMGAERKRQRPLSS